MATVGKPRLPVTVKRYGERNGKHPQPPHWVQVAVVAQQLWCGRTGVPWCLMSRMLIVIGVTILAIGLAWPLLEKLGLGRLPGDVVIRRGNFTFYFPIMTCIVISLVLSFLYWLLNR